MTENITKKNIPSRAKKRGLTQKMIIKAAIKLADKRGLEALSMRSLATSLGVEAMSLYNHVKNKDEILDQIVDTIFSQIKWVSDSKNWRRSMVDRACSTREVLNKHKWVVSLLESRSSPGPETLKHHDQVIGCFRKAGFSLPLTAAAFSALDAYVHGFLMTEQALPFETEEELRLVADQILSSFPKKEMPHLYELIKDHALIAGYSYHKEFLNGLDLILDSLELRFLKEQS